MTTAHNYCRSCFRDIGEDELFCAACAERSRQSSPASKVAFLLGVTGAPMLLIGMLGLNPRMCLIGAALAGAALLLKLVLLFR